MERLQRGFEVELLRSKMKEWPRDSRKDLLRGCMRCKKR